MPGAPVLARVAAVAVLVGLTVFGAATATASTVGWSPVTPAARPLLGRPLVLIGTSGLRWDDVGAQTTPGLWALARTGSVGTVATRSVGPFSCPADGWLALSAGARASDVSGAPYGECRTLRQPAADRFVPAWADYVRSAAQASYSAELGLLGDTLQRADVSATGIGPGAAIALADSAGRAIGDQVPRPMALAGLTQSVRDALGTSRLVVVDVGTVRDPGQLTVDRAAGGQGADSGGRPTIGATGFPEPGFAPGVDLTAPDALTEPTRSEQVHAVDERVRAVLTAIDGSHLGPTVLVASIADSGPAPRLQLAAAKSPSAGAGETALTGSFLESRSTRQLGYLMATDLNPTVLTALGIRDQAPVGALVGSPVTAVPGPPSASERVAAMIDQDRHAGAVRPLVAPFFTLLIIINLVLYAMVTLGLNDVALARCSNGLSDALPSRIGRWFALQVTRRPEVVLRGLRLAGVAVASIPVATFLANLSPWWRARPPSYALIALIVGWVAVITTLALAPRWRSWLLGPVGVVATVTAIVVGADIATGARLQISAVMGVQPLVGARFYGFNNTALALFAVTTILLAVALANPLVLQRRRGRAGAAVAAIGVSVTLFVGLPGVGSKFGGTPALVPAFAILTLLVAGVRLNWWKVLGVLALGVSGVVGFAVLDWMRPIDTQTHLGRFVQTVLDGRISSVLIRKASTNVQILFGNWLTVLAIAGIALVVFVLGRPLRAVAKAPDGGPFGWLSAGAPLTRLGTDVPVLRPGLIALALALGIGFALNDSGIVIPAIGVTVVVPLLVAACAGWLLRLRPAAPIPGTTLSVAQDTPPAS